MKTIIKILLIGLLFSLIALGLISCGSRKVNKEQIKEETNSSTIIDRTFSGNTSSNAKTTTTVKVDDKNETVTEEISYTPADPTKESFIIEKDGTKVVLNNVKKTVKKTTRKNNVKSESKTDIVEKKNTASKEQKAVKQVNDAKKETKSKQVDKKQFNPFVSICIGLFGLLALWCIYRFYKKLPLVPKL